MHSVKEIWADADRRSSFILVATLTLYTLLFGLVLGHALAQGDHGFQAADWVERHQTLIAISIAILGVVAAGDELKEMRRQHRATVRRSLKKELDALSAARLFAVSVAEYNHPQALIVSELVNQPVQPPLRPPETEIIKIEETLPGTIHVTARLLWDLVGAIRDVIRMGEEASGLIAAAKAISDRLRSLIADEEERLKEYWN